MEESLHRVSRWIWVSGNLLRQTSQKCIPFALYIFSVTQKSWD